MNVIEFVSLINEPLKNTTCECDRSNYTGWRYPGVLSTSLASKGKFDHKDDAIKRHGYEAYHPFNTIYWSDNAHIAIYYYPYHECEVYRCEMCLAIFLYYIERGGHSGEARLRWANPILFTDYNA